MWRHLLTTFVHCSNPIQIGANSICRLCKLGMSTGCEYPNSFFVTGVQEVYRHQVAYLALEPSGEYVGGFLAIRDQEVRRREQVPRGAQARYAAVQEHGDGTDQYWPGISTRINRILLLFQ